MTGDMVAVPMIYGKAVPVGRPRAQLYPTQQHKGNARLIVGGRTWMVPEFDRSLMIRGKAFIVLADNTVLGFSDAHEFVIPPSVAAMVLEAVGLTKKT